MESQGGLPRVVAILFILAIYSQFFICETSADNEPTVVINEIAWMGSALNANAEWIELKNNTAEAIDLTGWSLNAEDGIPAILLTGVIEPNAFFLLERTSDDTVPGVTADMIYVGALGNSGEILALKDSVGNVIDRIDASAGWPGGDNTAKTTMTRDADGAWTSSATAGGTPKTDNVIDSSQPSPECGNSVIENGETCDDGNAESSDGCSSLCRIEQPSENNESPSANTTPVAVDIKKYKPGDILINEFVSDPSDNDTEWIEIYNNTNNEVDLAGWHIEDGSNTKTVLSGKIGVTGAGRFLIVEKPKGSLNNDGDAIKLYDSSNNLIDRVIYGNWNEGGQESNAPKANDPFSTARLYDGYNTYNNKNDFTTTKELTRGKSNIVVNEDNEIDAEEKKNYDLSDDIIISEILPNPAGADNENEFIELYNQGDREVALSGWSAADASGQKFEMKAETRIQPRAYLAVYRKESGIALNNNFDSVILFKPFSEKAFATVKYKNAKEGFSYNYDRQTKKWDWSENVTPDKDNVFKKLNQPPQANFDCPSLIGIGEPYNFDSSDALDPDNDKLKFEWDFGDSVKSNLASPQHTYLKAGTYNLKLSVNDGQAETRQNCLIKIGSTSDNQPIVEDAGLYTDLIGINELMPNPEGADADGEWIEIINYGLVKINLLNWRLDDGEIGQPYNFTDSFWLEAGKYLVLEREESKLSLNNDTDKLELYDSSGRSIEKVKYSGAKEGLSYAKGKDNKWTWTVSPTPGSANEILVVSAVKSSNKKTTKKTAKTQVEIDLGRIGEFEIGDQLKVSGVVAVLPGILGTQFFYIVGARGLQIYSYKKDFPGLKIGDLVSVAGELSEINGEKRLKTSSKNDIKIIGTGIAPVPVSLTGDHIDDNSVGQLVSLKGEIVDAKGSSIYLDDGTDEAEIYLKKGTGASVRMAKPGSQATVIGIVSKAKSGPRVLPRSKDDILINSVDDKGQVLGELAESDAWMIEQREKKLTLFKYLLVIAVAIILVMSVLMIKQKRENKTPR